NSPPPLASHRNAGSMSAARACASASRVTGAGSANRSSTFAALIFTRLPDAVSTCSDVSLSARIVPALNAPSSSKKTCMGSEVAAEGGANYTVMPALVAGAVALLHDGAGHSHSGVYHGIPPSRRQRSRSIGAVPRHDDVRRPHRRLRRAAHR